MRNAVIVEAIRTPSGKGKPGGQLSGIHPAHLLSQTLSGLMERSGVDPSLLDDVLVGCVSQAGEQTLNIGRTAVLGAGFPEHVPATTIDRQCGSSQQALHFAAQGVMAGAYDLVIAGGVESMSRVPMGSSAMGQDPQGPDVAGRYAPGLVGQGVSAELIAARWDLGRESLDALAARSHELAEDATRQGAFEREVLPVKHEGQTLDRDETIRPGTSVEALSGLPSSFHDPDLATRFLEARWDITPGNSSPLTDGASAVLVTSEERARELGLQPRARVHTTSVVGDDPLLMLTGPIPATRRVLDRSGLGIDDIDLFEVNEAFAPVPLAWQQELCADLERVNVRGGAIALGHPLGASGTRLMTTLLHALEDRDGRFGLQTMCEGGGMANATIIERM